MKSTLSAPLDIDANRRLLNRYRYVTHEAMRIFAGWLPQTARFELKCELGRTIWENSQHVNALYLRLREIQSPAFQQPADAALVRLMEELIHAPDEYALALAYYGVVTPGLIAALENHEAATFPNSDLPSVRAIQHMLLDLRAEQARLHPILSAAAAAGRITPRRPRLGEIRPQSPRRGGRCQRPGIARSGPGGVAGPRRVQGPARGAPR